MTKKTVNILFLFFIPLVLLAGPEVGFSVKFDGVEKATSLNRFFYMVLPGKSFEFLVTSLKPEQITATCNYGELAVKGPGKWKYTAPEKSATGQLVITDVKTGEAMTVTLFILVPRTEKKGEYLNGYRIGNYPEENFRGRKNYKKPEGFIEVTKDNKDIYITPHFQLKQFLCKQGSGWPEYMIINPNLLIKLEYIVSGLHEEGFPVKTLFIMSGYRTPYYNHAIGNVKYSRHIYGDASDIYVDENHDNVIDDLDKNGKHELADAMVIYAIINRFENDPENEHLIGGMGKYNKNSAHTYFIHVDTRGYKARW